MSALFTPVFILLLLCVLLSVFRTGRVAKWLHYFRMFTVLLAIFYFVYHFYKQSTEHFVKDAVSVQVVNSIPQPIDFYLITSKDNSVSTQHLGEIRPEHFRISYDTAEPPHELSVAGFLGKKNMVYFMHKVVKSKTEDQIVEAKNYYIQNDELSKKASEQIEIWKKKNVKRGVYQTLALMMLFINAYLVFKKFFRISPAV